MTVNVVENILVLLNLTVGNWFPCGGCQVGPAVLCRSFLLRADCKTIRRNTAKKIENRAFRTESDPKQILRNFAPPVTTSTPRRGNSHTLAAYSGLTHTVRGDRGQACYNLMTLITVIVSGRVNYI